MLRKRLNEYIGKEDERVENMKQMDRSWGNITEIVIYGFGKNGKGMIDELSKQFKVEAIIDNGMQDAASYKGIPIMSYEKYCETDSDTKIIVTASGRSLADINKSLQENGKVEYLDYMSGSDFIALWNWQFRNKVCMGRVTLAITEKCSLRCKDCSGLIPYINNPVHYSLEEIYEGLDLFFSIVDRVAALYIMGGEALLHPSINEIFGYISSRFSDKIGKIVLLMNGTIIPKDSTIQTLKALGIRVRISDYSITIPYKHKLEDLIYLLKRNEIDYQIEKYDEWIDMGRPDENIQIGNSPEEIREHMKKCNVECILICKSKFYYCNRVMVACEAFDYKDIEGDYLELKELAENIQTGRKEIVNFYLGNLVHGYCRFCQKCRGYQSNIMVKPAEQM